MPRPDVELPIDTPLNGPNRYSDVDFQYITIVPKPESEEPVEE